MARRPFPRWSRILGRVVAGGLVILSLVAIVAGGWFWWQAQRLFEPSVTSVRPTLAGYADEAPSRVAGAKPAAPSLDWNRLEAPPREAMPWVRWWWPGADVEAEELKRELTVLRDAGFGGAEIQPFTMGTFAVAKADPVAAARINAVDTPGYFALLHGVLRDARELGMGIDLTHYSGWPGGSPAVTPAENTQSLAWSEQRFSGGKRVSIRVPRPTPGANAWALAFASLYSGLGDFGDFDPASARLVSAVVARPDGGGHSKFSLRDTQRLDPGSVRVVDGFIRDGMLVWDAPPGEWLLIASWILPTGEQASLAASKAPNYIVDILNARAVDAEYNYVFGRRSGLAEFYGSPLRAIFNDSLEFKADRLVSRDFLQEFRRRRGYDLRPYLPVVYRSFADNFTLGEIFPKPAPDFALSDQDERVRYDYQQTLSELVVERFVDRSRRWTQAHGLLSRGQSYGMDLDILAALGANDVPETEQLYGGGSDAFLRFASSAAMLYGRSRVSAESFVWADQDYASSGAKLKLAADRFFLAGVNEIIYHGYPYDWRRQDRSRWFSSVGWDPWSAPERNNYIFSGNYSERTPLWTDIRHLNSYIARAQNLLRQGRQHADVLIYYPFLGYRTRGYGPQDTREPLMFGEFALTNPADGGASGRNSAKDVSTDERVLWLRRVQPLLAALAACGLTWSWVNDDVIRRRLGKSGRTRDGAAYGGLVFAQAPTASVAALSRATDLARAGTPVVVWGAPPRRQPGLHDAARGDEQVSSLAAALAQARPINGNARSAADTIAEAVRPAFRYASSEGVRRYRRELVNGGAIDFFANITGRPQRVSLNAWSAGNWWFDAMSGAAAPVKRDAANNIVLDLAPYESRFLVSGVAQPRSAQASALGLRPSRTWSVSDWHMTLDGKQWRGFFDWRSNAELQHEARSVRYRATVTIPAKLARAHYVLRLQPQAGTAAAFVNGNSVGVVSVPPAAPDITGLLRTGANRIEIVYQAPIRNAMIGASIKGDKRLAQFKGRKSKLVPAGLRGPIEVVELSP